MRLNQVRVLLGLLVSLSAGALLFAAPQHAQENAPRWKTFAQLNPDAPQGLGDAYVLTRDNGQTICRPMNETEARQLKIDRERTGLRIIHSASEAQSERSFERLETQQGLKIILRGTAQLDSFPEAKTAFLRAAALWESVIATPITVVIDVDYGTTRFGQAYPANVIGSTSSQILGDSNGYPDFRQALIENAQTPAQAAIFNALPAGSIKLDMGTTTGAYAPSSVLRAMGILDPVADPSGETQYGAPPAIGFNSAIPFDLDPSNGIDFDKIDFNATAAHEIGHALGFSSLAGYRELSTTFSLSPSVWDIFRFHPGVGLNTFGTEARSLLSGGEQITYAGGEEFALSTGRPDGSGGDGRQASHWKDDSATGQYIGLMDPTATDGQREDITAADLTALRLFGYKLKSNLTMSETLSVDDNTRESGTGFTGALIVNRFTPARYPATVRGLKTVIRVITDSPSPAGGTLRVVVFGDPNRTGQPPTNPALQFDRTFTVPNIAASRFVEFTFDGPAINSGDFYIGVQATGVQFNFGVDTTGQPLRESSFISTDNGASFQTLKGNLSTTTAKLMLRALVAEPFDATPAPSLAAGSPSSIAPGGPAFTLTVQGAGFKSDSVVKWNGGNRPTTFISSSRLQAAISAADIAGAGSAAVTVTTPGGGDSAAFTVSIAAENPAPAITGLTPTQAPVGTTLTINVFGRNFTPNSVVRVGGNNRATTFVDSTQVSALLPTSDLASAGNSVVTVVNPAPGGGTSNEAAFGVVACSYSLSASTQSFNSTGGSSGVVLTAIGSCGWSAMADVPWITFTAPDNASGVGNNVITYRLAANTSASLRTGNVTIGGRSVLVRQAGVLTTVSAANFGLAVAPEAIVAAFGAGLANNAQTATATPLPTNLGGVSVRVTDSAGASRSAPLFFVSPTQVNYQIPVGTATGTAMAAVSVDGLLVSTGALNVGSVAPSLFSANSSGQGIAAAVLLRVKPGNQQSFEPIAEFNAAQNKFVAKPIDLGPETDQVFLVLFGTGVRGRSLLSAVTAQVGGLSISPQFAGPQGTLVGVDQINLPLARSLKGRGEVQIELTVDGKTANTVTVTIQ